MGLPTFAADSRFDKSTVTVTASPVAATGFPVSNLSDDRIFSVFKSSDATSPLDIITDEGVGNTATVDYFGMVGHNLGALSTAGNQVTIVFAHSPDNIVYTTIFTQLIPVGDDTIIFRSFATTVARRFFRLRITRATPPFASAPEIGELQWGTKVEASDPSIAIGFDPVSERVQMRSTRSQTGNILGTVQSFVSRTANIRLRLQSGAFTTGTAIGQFKEFWDNHASLGKPFFWAWNPGDPGSFEKDTFFAVIQNDATLARPLATPLDTGFRDIQFSVVGLKES